MKLLSLGDSYTEGYLVDSLQAYPKQLADALRSGGLDISEPRSVAYRGWTTADLLTGLSKAALEPPYDLVTLLIGANDQVTGVSENIYDKNFQKLLSKSIELAGNRPSRVIVISIPDYGVTPYFINPSLKRNVSAAVSRFNEINRRAAKRAGADYADIVEISRLMENAPELTASDGFHPSAEMYAEWVKLIAPIAEKILRGR